MLDLSSLQKSIDSLDRSLNVAHSNANSPSVDLWETIRAGVIQNFEVAYEQCWKFIQRWIRENRAPEDADNPKTRKDLFRLAARYGLIATPEAWFAYGNARNLTSHTYDPKEADVVFEMAEQFVADAKYLLGKMKSHND